MNPTTIRKQRACAVQYYNMGRKLLWQHLLWLPLMGSCLHHALAIMTHSFVLGYAAGVRLVEPTCPPSFRAVTIRHPSSLQQHFQMNRPTLHLAIQFVVQVWQFAVRGPLCLLLRK